MTRTRRSPLTPPLTPRAAPRPARPGAADLGDAWSRRPGRGRVPPSDPVPCLRCPVDAAPLPPPAPSTGAPAGALLPLQARPAAGVLPAGLLAAPHLGAPPWGMCPCWPLPPGARCCSPCGAPSVRGGTVAPLPLPALPPLEVTLARFRPAGSEGPDWMLVEVDGKALRAAPGAGSERIEEALAAAGLRLADEDRVEILPAAGRASRKGRRAPRRAFLARRRRRADHPPRGRAHRGRGPRHLGRGRVPRGRRAAPAGGRPWPLACGWPSSAPGR